MKDTNAFSLAGRKKRHAALLKNKASAYPLSASASAIGILFPQSPVPTMQASVIVPAKDESAHIIHTLEALRNQTGIDGQPLPHDIYEVLLLTNNCKDDTFQLASQYQMQHPQFRLHIADIQLDKNDAHIGTARRLLMDEAFRHHSLNGNDGLILSTDGDTEVDSMWVARTLYEMKDCEALGGRILTRNIDAGNKWYYLLDSTYRCLAAKLETVICHQAKTVEISHFQCFGASLAVRCSAYQLAGRLPAIPYLEDEAFSRALYRVDARIKKSSAVKVYTSGRVQGKVQIGLSVHLAHLGNLQKENSIVFVESLSTLLEKYSIKHWLYKAWHRQGKGGFDASLLQVELMSGLSYIQLLKILNLSFYFGECWEQVEAIMYKGKWKQKQKPVPIREAIYELRHYLKNNNRALPATAL